MPNVRLRRSAIPPQTLEFSMAYSNSSQITNSILHCPVTEDLYTRLFTFDDYRSLIQNQLYYLEQYADRLYESRLPIEILIISSKNETAGNVEMRARLTESFSDLKQRTFDDGGHAPAFLNPGNYRRAVSEFLDQ